MEQNQGLSMCGFVKYDLYFMSYAPLIPKLAADAINFLPGYFLNLPLCTSEDSSSFPRGTPTI